MNDELDTFSLHARPLVVKPPRPQGQESDTDSIVGFLKVRPFIEIPSLAIDRKFSQRARSSNSSLFSLRVWFRCPNLLSLTLNLDRKCLESGTTQDAWFNLPMTDSNMTFETDLCSLARMLVISRHQATYLSSGSEQMRRRVSSSQPRAIWTSAGVLSASSFASESVCHLSIGSFSPAFGLIATCMARGAEAACLLIYADFDDITYETISSTQGRCWDVNSEGSS
jgi:hypothetical protein